MLKLEITVNELDYAALADVFLPLMAQELRRQGHPMAAMLSASPTMAKKLLASLPQEQRDALAATVINQNAPEMARRAEERAAEQGVHARVLNVRASAWGP